MSDQTIFVTLRYRSARGAIAWLEACLGFEVTALFEADDGSVAHAQLRFGTSELMLGESNGESFGGPAWTYLVDDDPDALHDRAAAAGAEIVMAPTDQDYGSREFTVRDPGGNLWTIGTYRPA
ncbi:MAG: VOC family protein [Acidimicrobiia bacterium]|nr:VOC family protein [Acidimicrobiia bacterium]